MKKRINIIQTLSNLLTLKDQLKFIVENFPKSYISMIKSKKYQQFDFIKRINISIPKISSNEYSLITKIYWIINDISEFPLCENDGKPLVGINVKNIIDGYGKMLACSKECENRIKYQHIVKSNIQKYGFANPFSFCKSQIQQSHIEKYGNVCPANNKKIRDKIEQKNLERYGVKSYSSTKECREKVEKTCMKRFGVKSSLRSEKAIQRKKQVSLQRWGVENQNSSLLYQQHKKEKLIQKYGKDYGKILWGGKGNIYSNKRAYLYMTNSSLVIPMFSEDEYIQMKKDGKSEFLFRCKKCEKTFTSYWDDGHAKSCPYCCFNGGISQKEREITEFVESLIGQDSVVRNSRQIIAPLEIDLYIPSKKLAIEFDGLYWHSDDVKTNFKYHLIKTEMCEYVGIQLIHIFENEWIYKKNIVKSRIRNLFGIYDVTVFARNCQVKEVDSKTSKEFQENNHIQGSVNAKVSLGLYYNSELISLMTFGKSRFNKKYEWEMLRFCNKLGYHIPGAAGKLLKHFEINYKPKNLISYADRRWSQGKLYRKLGFLLDHSSIPDYWYFNYPSMILYSRVKFQKYKLKNILEYFDENKTEVENMKNNGYYRIFDCGNLVFVKNYI